MHVGTHALVCYYCLGEMLLPFICLLAESMA